MIYSVGKKRNGNSSSSIFDDMLPQSRSLRPFKSSKLTESEESFENHVPEMKRDQKREADERLRKNQSRNRDWLKPPEEQIVRANNSEMVSRGGKILSQSGSKDISTEGGNHKQLKQSHQNTIWEPNVLPDHPQSNDEKTSADKAEIARLRKGMKQGRIDEMVEAAQDVDLRKTDSVKQTGEFKGGTYRAPRNGMSIFDFANNFERVPEQTAGEKVTEEIKKGKTKDDSWRNPSNQKVKTTGSAISNLVDKLMEEKK